MQMCPKLIFTKKNNFLSKRNLSSQHAANELFVKIIFFQNSDSNGNLFEGVKWNVK